MKNLNFSIGILSWKGYASLYNSLKSYEENGLNSLTKSKFICLPEYNNEGIKICENFGYKPILFKKNIGIFYNLFAWNKLCVFKMQRPKTIKIFYNTY